MNTDDVNTQVSILTGVFNECLNGCAPIVTKEIRRPPASWITDEVKLAMANRDRLRLVRDENFSDMTHENYKKSKSNVKIMIKHAKVKHFQKKY